jgi:hypothetical protein
MSEKEAAKEVEAMERAKVGLYKLKSVDTHSLKPPGFNPITRQVRSRFPSLCAFKCNLHRYTKALASAAATAGASWGMSADAEPSERELELDAFDWREHRGDFSEKQEKQRWGCTSSMQLTHSVP